MAYDQELIKANVELAKYLTVSSAQIIGDKIRASKAKKNDGETINNLEEIINTLISEKNELISIAQTYDAHVVSQKISEDDILYITESIIPLLEEFIENSDNDQIEESLRRLELFKPLLSKETFKILQILGFNFRAAVGEPLTGLVKSLISSHKSESNDMEYHSLIAKRDIEYFKMIQDEESYERFLDLKNQG